MIATGWLNGKAHWVDGNPAAYMQVQIQVKKDDFLLHQAMDDRGAFAMELPPDMDRHRWRGSAI
jgi:hypothetical protein